jgi:hypothetical protein
MSALAANTTTPILASIGPTFIGHSFLRSLYFTLGVSFSSVPPLRGA